MSWHRRQFFLCTVWLARLMAGEISCPWSVWFRAHFGGYKSQSSSPQLAAWQATHNAAVVQLAAEVEAAGARTWVEQQNGFKLRVAPNLVLSGQPDLVGQAAGVTTIYDRKTGIRRTSDQLQVMLYVLCYPTAFPDRQVDKLVGCLVYNGNQRDYIDTDAIMPGFRRTVREYVNLIAADTPPRRLPSFQGCIRCDITTTDCPERMDQREEPVDEPPALDWEVV
jgi:hypothetical protein